jgi:hypothetical protein
MGQHDDQVRRMIQSASGPRPPVQQIAAPINDVQLISLLAAILGDKRNALESTEEAATRRRAACLEAIEVIAVSATAVRDGDLHRAIHRATGVPDPHGAPQ